MESGKARLDFSSSSAGQRPPRASPEPLTRSPENAPGWMSIATARTASPQISEASMPRARARCLGWRTSTASARADEKGSQRDQPRDNRKASASCNHETEEDDVSGHIRGEYPTEPEVADGIDQASRKGQHQERSHERMLDAGRRSSGSPFAGPARSASVTLTLHS